MFAECGDGEKEGREQCDDGNDDDDDDCPNHCRLPVCGNGILEGDEECDDDNKNNGDGCSKKCMNEAVCGNDEVEEGEECDGEENCLDDCTIAPLINSNVVKIAGASTLSILLVLFFFLRKKIAKIFKTSETSKKLADGKISLDDIPLDELEMPWHKWNK